MKQLLILFLLLCSASVVQAQDVIVKKDGSTVVCRVVKLNSTEIVYKKWNDLNGSNYIMDRSLASAINYENGRKENLAEVENLYQPGNQNDGVQQYNDRALLELDASLHKKVRILTPKEYYKSPKRWRQIGWGLGATYTVVGVIFFCIGDNGDSWSKKDSNLSGSILVGGGVACIVGSQLYAKHLEKKNEKQLNSASLYQQELKLGNGTSLSAGIDLLTDHTETGRTFGSHTLGLGLRYNF